MNTELFISVIEIIGIISFASSGAMVGIHKKMDAFGVIVMAITTSVGGGVIRDLILGITPPGTFKDPVYVEVAIGTSVVLFIVLYLKKQILYSRAMMYYERLMTVIDAVGLGTFTVIGVQTAYDAGYETEMFLLVFVGVVTGVGGGVLRDMMAKNIPFIFVKHIYACASLAGAIICAEMIRYHRVGAMILGAVTVCCIRLLAARYRWNMPRVEMEDEEDEKNAQHKQ